MIHVFNYRDKNYIYDVGSGSLHECDKPTADYLKAKELGQDVDITYLSDAQVAEILSDVDELTKAGVEVLYDDRDIRPGAMFADADLLGIPVRVVVSPKTCDRDVVEVSFRDKSFKADIAIDTATEEIAKLVKAELAKYNI